MLYQQVSCSSRVALTAFLKSGPFSGWSNSSGYCFAWSISPLMTASSRQGCWSSASSASARGRALLWAFAFALAFAFGDGVAVGVALAFAARRGREAAAFALAAFALGFALGFPFAVGRAALVAGAGGAAGASGASAVSPTWETFVRRQRRLGLGSSSGGGCWTWWSCTWCLQPVELLCCLLSLLGSCLVGWRRRNLPLLLLLLVTFAFASIFLWLPFPFLLTLCLPFPPGPFLGWLRGQLIVSRNEASLARILHDRFSRKNGPDGKEPTVSTCVYLNK